MKLRCSKLFLNIFENVTNRRVDIPEDIQRFQKTLQYARSKVDYAIGEFIYMLPSDMNLQIGEIKLTMTRYWYHHLASTLELI